MIIVSGKPFNIADIARSYSDKSIELKILNILNGSSEKYTYDTLEQLKFELTMRKQIISTSNELYRSAFSFDIFRRSKCNNAFWKRTADGGFELRDGAKPSAAIMDIFKNGSKYATECATAMVIVYYKAILDMFGDELFDKTFPQIELMNWHRIDPLLSEVGQIQRRHDYFPGDRRYFDNPDVNPKTPEWQGENVIDFGDGFYYGHGIGIYRAEKFIKALNENRTNGAETSSYLMDAAGRPNFAKLASILSHT